MSLTQFVHVLMALVSCKNFPVNKCHDGSFFSLKMPPDNWITDMTNLASKWRRKVRPPVCTVNVYSRPPLVRPLYLPRICGHVREVAFGVRQK